MTKTLACEWGPHKVRVVGLVPGPIAGTEGFARLSDMSLMGKNQESKQAFTKAQSEGKDTNATNHNDMLTPQRVMPV